MSFLKKTFLFTLLLLPLCQIFSQEYLFDAKLLTKEDGLSNSLTSSAYKDKNGYLWIGTNNGLDRYDGYHFTSYKQNKSGLHRNNSIHQIREDDTGNLWLSYFSKRGHVLTSLDRVDAIDIFNPHTGKAIPFDVFFENKAPFSSSDLLDIRVIDAKNRIWLTTKNGELYLFEKGQFLKIYEQKDASFQYVTVDNKDNIWLGSEKTITKINLDGEIEETQQLSNDLIGIWTDDNEQLWWATTEHEIAKFIDKPKKNNTTIWSKDKEGAIIRFTLNKDNKIVTFDISNFFFLHRSKAGHWYAQIEGQLNIFNQEGQFIYNYHDLIGKGLQTSYNNYIEVANNEFWFSTPRGLIRTTTSINSFKLIQGNEEYSDCRGIVETENGAILFLNTGLYQYHPKSTEPPEKKMLKGYFALAYTDSIVWSGTYNRRSNGNQLDLRTQEKYDYEKADKLNSFLSFATLKITPLSDYLVGTDKGLCYLNIKQKQIRPFTQYNGFDVLKESGIYHLHKNAKGIWLATNNGVFLMDEKEGIIRHYNLASKDLPVNFIHHIHETKEGVFWLATKEGGMIQWKPTETEGQISTYQQFTTENGLSDNTTYAIYGDEYGKLWIPSDKGLMCFNKNTYQIRTYSTKDGLSDNEFNLTAHYQAKDGTFYFGGLGGLISFHPKIFKNQSAENIPLRFTKFSVLEENARVVTDKTDLLQRNSEIIIQPTDRFLEFYFSLMDYDAPDQHQYAYKIEGFHNNWIYTNDNYLRITNLPYGYYKLEIKGKNLNTGWSSNESVLGIKVLKPFYLQWWFLLLVIICFIVTILLMIKWRTLRFKEKQLLLETEVKRRTLQIQQDKITIEAQSEKLKSLDKVKTRFFTNITHELKTPLTLIIGPIGDILKKEKVSPTVRTQLVSTQKNAQQLTNLIEEILDLSKLEANQLILEEKKVAFYTLLRRLFATYFSYANYRSIDLQLNYQANQYLQILIDVKKFEKVINNLLSNALKFTPSKGKIMLTAEDLGGQLKIIISDNGRGIHPGDLPFIFDRYFQTNQSNTITAGGTGIGLSLSKEYAKMLDGTLTVESEYGKGSTFTLLIPKKEIFSDVYESITPSENSNLQQPIVKLISKSKKHHILIVEDNKDVADYMASILEETYNLTLADNGITALEYLSKLDFHLIISDVMMPQMDGFQLLDAVKQQEKWLLTPFIMVTARTEAPDRLQALKLGVDDYLTKPFLSEELLVRVGNLLSNYNARKTHLKEVNKTTSFAFESVPTANTLWLQELETIVKDNLKESHFNVNRLVFLLHISESNLRNKIKSYTGLTPVEYIREARLNKARHLLENKRYNTVSEVVYAIGMKHPANFTKMYKRRFGKLPSEYSQAKM